ncbi:MAG: bifunctional helix-turn-helix transcriptional regulator/GNAT family N-acetyltransferase [Algibacter sp.]
MDALQGFGELGLGSRLKRVSEYMMKETQLVYDYYQIAFDPYLFPVFKIITNKKGVTNKDIKHALKISQPAITQTINKLNKKGLIDFKDDEIDKRKKIIRVSKKGKTLLKQLIPIWKNIDLVIKDYTLESSCSLIEHLNKLEHKLNMNSFSQTVIEKINEAPISELKIISYKPEYAKKFYDLNIEWLKAYFVVEPYDEDVLSKPQEYIINKGGHIFFAQLNNEIVGTVALMPIGNEGLVELTKMGVSPKHRGHKIGQKLMQYCIDYAKGLDLPNLILYSNKKLENAIYIYRKFGFIEQPIEPNSPYKRSDIKMKLEF